MAFFKNGPIDENRFRAIEKGQKKISEEIKQLKKLVRNIRAGNDMLERNIKHVKDAVQHVDEVYGKLTEEQRDIICQSKSKQ